MTVYMRQPLFWLKKEEFIHIYGRIREIVESRAWQQTVWWYKARKEGTDDY